MMTSTGRHLSVEYDTSPALNRTLTGNNSNPRFSSRCWSTSSRHLNARG